MGSPVELDEVVDCFEELPVGLDEDLEGLFVVFETHFSERFELVFVFDGWGCLHHAVGELDWGGGGAVGVWDARDAEDLGGFSGVWGGGAEWEGDAALGGGGGGGAGCWSGSGGCWGGAEELVFVFVADVALEDADGVFGAEGDRVLGWVWVVVGV